MRNQNDVIKVLEKHEYNLTDNFVALIFERILKYQMELDENFEEKASPYLSHYIRLMNHEHS